MCSEKARRRIDAGSGFSSTPLDIRHLVKQFQRLFGDQRGRLRADPAGMCHLIPALGVGLGNGHIADAAAGIGDIAGSRQRRAAFYLRAGLVEYLADRFQLRTEEVERDLAEGNKSLKRLIEKDFTEADLRTMTEGRVRRETT